MRYAGHALIGLADVCWRARDKTKGLYSMLNSVVRSSRVVALAAMSMALIGIAHADVSLKLGGRNVAATNLSFNVSHTPVYDQETYVPVVPAKTTFTAGSIYVTRNFDGASTEILKHVIGNDKLGTLEMTVSDAGSRTVWSLSNAVLNNYSTYSGEDNKLVENFDITYTTATLKTYAGNSTTPSDTVTWTVPPVTQ
jgi:type VI protein secretion system component Hcp